MIDEAQRQAAMERLKQEREAAIRYLQDTVGCLIVDSSNQRVSHMKWAIADKIRIVADFTNGISCVQVEQHELIDSIAAIQFNCSCRRGDYPTCLLVFNAQAIQIFKDVPVTSEYEHLMRAGIILQVQSDDTALYVRNELRDNMPSLTVDYTENRTLFSVGDVDISGLLTTFVVGANFATRTVSVGNLGLKWT